MSNSGGALLLGGNERSLEQRRTLVASLFRQPRSLALSKIGSLVAAWVCWKHTGQAAYLWWGLACLVVLAFRLKVASAFHGHPDRLLPEAWARLFLAGAVATAIAIGTGIGATVLWCDDMVAQLYMACNIISFAGGVAVRNNASPLAARCQTVIALGGPGLACLASGKPYLEIFSFLILLHLVAQFEIIRALGLQTCRLMSNEQEQASANARLSEACDQLACANASLVQLSSTDGLTGLSNRRAFDAALQAEWDRCRRDACPLALLMIDADQFKRFNDRHGHAAGDDALRLVAGIISDALRRPADCGARFGGEEFSVLMHDTGLEGALAVAERIRRAVSSAPVPDLPDERVTVSIGVAAMVPRPEQDCRELVVKADEALYEAKRDGRNLTRGAHSIAGVLA